MTLLIVNVCAFANRTANLPQHVGAMSWHQAKFHYFHACFGFTGIKKLSFSMFPTQPRCPEFWIYSHFLHGTEKFTRGHTCDFSTNFGALEHVLVFQIWITHTNVTRSLPEPRAFLREAPICKKLIPKFVPIQPIFLPRHGTTMTWHHAKFHDFKTKFLNVLDRATMPRCLNFIFIFCMGPTPSFHLYSS